MGTKIALCIPHANAMVSAEFAKCLFALGKTPDTDIFSVYYQPVARARNELVCQVLKYNERTNLPYTHIVFLDDDIIVQFYTIKELVVEDKDIIGVWCPLKTAEPKSNVFEPHGYNDTAESIGMGCVAIKIGVFETMSESVDLSDMEWFKWAGSTRSPVSEDIYFCRRAKMFGYEIHVHPTLKAEHLGLVAFTTDGVKCINRNGGKDKICLDAHK